MIFMDLCEKIGYPQKFEGYISSISSCPPIKIPFEEVQIVLLRNP